MAKKQPLKIKKKLENIYINDYVKFLYNNDNENKIVQTIKNDINGGYEDFLIYKSKNKKILYVYTKKNIYEIKNQEVINQFDRFKMQLQRQEIQNLIKHMEYKIYPEVIKKFYNQNVGKIEQIINKFLEEGEIRKIKNNKELELKHKSFDFIFIIDIHYNIIKGVRKYNNQILQNYSIIIKKNKLFVKKDVLKEDKIEANIFLKQINLLQSNICNINFAKNDIFNNFKTITKGKKHEQIIVQTYKYTYIISNYNIISVIPYKKDMVYLEKKQNISKLGNDKYCINISIDNFYSGKDNAKKYLNQLGLSIRVITKFITENNIQDLFNFLIQDILNYGIVLYDNYIDNCMIIKTNRYYYFIKNNIILNIKTLNNKEIKDCSILFKAFYKKRSVKKTTILDLDIGDEIRNYITQDYIDKLILKEHAVKRYKERISEKSDYTIIEYKIKKDIYREGKVYLGTYYNNTKLIRGLKRIYITDNKYIISVWNVNPVIEEINCNYKNIIEELNSLNISENEII